MTPPPPIEQPQPSPAIIAIKRERADEVSKIVTDLGYEFEITPDTFRDWAVDFKFSSLSVADINRLFRAIPMDAHAGVAYVTADGPVYDPTLRRAAGEVGGSNRRMACIRSATTQRVGEGDREAVEEEGGLVRRRKGVRDPRRQTDSRLPLPAIASRSKSMSGRSIGSDSHLWKVCGIGL